MGWICKYCSTVNDEGAKKCFVCDNVRSYSYIKTLTPVRVSELGLKGDVVIPKEYNVIGTGAFKGRTDITSVTIHSGVRKIMKEAFSGCVNLRHIDNKAELSSIGERAFYNCRSLPSDNRPTAKYVHGEAFVAESSGSSCFPPSAGLLYSSTASHPVAYTYASAATPTSARASSVRGESASARATPDHTGRSDTASVRGDGAKEPRHWGKWFVRFMMAGVAVASLVSIVLWAIGVI